MEALSRRPRMRRLLLTTTSMLLSDLSSAISLDNPKAIKRLPGPLAGIDTSTHNGKASASASALPASALPASALPATGRGTRPYEDSDEDETLEDEEYFET